MPYIKVDTGKLSGIGSDISNVKTRVNSIRASFYSTGSALDWDVKACAGINKTISQINSELTNEIASLKRMESFFTMAVKKYSDANEYSKKYKITGKNTSTVWQPSFSREIYPYIWGNTKPQPRSIGIPQTIDIKDMSWIKVSSIINYNARASASVTISKVDTSIIKKIILLLLKNLDTGSSQINIETNETVARVFDFLANSIEGINKIAKDDDFSVSSVLVKYINSLYKFATGTYEDGWDVTSGWMSLIKNSAKVENSIYGYYINKLAANEGFALYNKFGSTINNVNLIGSFAGFIENTINTIKTITNENSKPYESIGEYVKLVGSGIGTLGTVYITENYSSMVISAVGKNQILAVPKVVSQNATGLKNAGAFITIADAAASFFSSGIKKHGELSEDGTVDMGDWGATGITAAINGLAKMPILNIISAVTDAATGVDANDFADIVIDKAGEIGVQIGNKTVEWLNRHPDMNNLVHNEDANPVLRESAKAVSMIIASGEAVAGKVVDGTRNTVAGWFAKLKSLF